MIKNLLLSIAVVFAGIAVLFLVFTLLDLLGAYAKYKKATWELEIKNNR